MYTDFNNTQNTRNIDMLTVMTCGSVDDGKSTLIGRLLWDTNQVFEDQKIALAKDSERFGTQGKNLDYALLVDGLSAEREQGITIDVAYRYFTSPIRKFIIADTPGHEQYTRNMVTAASNADAAIILVDAQKGILSQTRRHTALLALMQVPHIILAINKMDLCTDPQSTYQTITQAFETYTSNFRFTSLVSIPIVAIRGENIALRSQKMDWYSGSTLLGHLETLETSRPLSETMTLPVQWVNRPNSNFRGYSGTLASGRIHAGDNVRLIRSGEVVAVTKVIRNRQEVSSAIERQAITICLDREIDVSRGDIFTLDQLPIETSDTFSANLVWMHTEPGYTGRSYLLKMAHKTVRAQIVTLKHKLDIVHQAELSTKDIQCNDIVKIVIRTSERIGFTPYSDNKTLGGFILIDPTTKMTIAAGTLEFSMRRSANTHTQALTVQRQQRAELNGHRGLAVWLTGLSGSGKSTLANQLEQALFAEGIRTYILDGDNIRQGLCKDLGFTPTDRIENIRRIAEVANVLVDAGIVVIVATISPYAADRQMAKDTIGTESFLEVYVDTPLEVCEQRDPKGLYKKARKGELPGFTGIDSPYEIPEKPDVVYTSPSSTIESLLAEVTISIRTPKTSYQ